ncbi:SDR family NAD(P)-dependent oxidoreductase [Actinomadura scrupuli]|uniref:SDR family NAD(P)-dependent oxidoreductase n=1 Tax=Actinomadura scrupuli TaxID=559629 RepID=UPI003D970BD1
MIRCDDRVVLVTGAAKGIGAATAGLFAAAGASLALCDRDPPSGTADAAAMLGCPVLAATLDVRDDTAVRHFTEAVEDRFGRVDVLVNNAGGTFHAPFLEVSGKGEATLIEENFTQVTRLIRLLVPLMPAGGSIVNITSSEAHQAAPGFAVYAAMKAAVESLTRTLALELAPRGLRVNAIAPDALPTGGEQAVRDQMLADQVSAGRTPTGYEPVRLPPLGFLGSPDDAAGAVLFLASDLARFVTGETLHVDGGIWAAGGWRRTLDPP